MNGDTCFFLMSSDDSLVNMMSVESFSAKFREQCGMNIDNPIRKSIDKVLRNKPKEPGKDYQVNAESHYLSCESLIIK